MKKNVIRVVLAVIAVLLVVGGLGAVKAGQIGSMIEAGKSFTPPPESVTTTKVGAEQWEAGLGAVGSVVPVRTVVIASELPGLVKELGFDSGQAVQKGAVLVRLDTSIEEAQLAAAEAEAELAQVNLQRSQTLRNANVNAAQDLDLAQARAKQTAAQVQSIQATIAKKTIRAPFSGKLGIRQVELGQVLGSGTPLVPLTALDPVYVEHYLPQQSLSKLAVGQAVRISTDAYPGEQWTGKVAVIDDQIDATTRNVRVRSMFTNTDGRLRPGMFVNSNVLMPEKSRVLAIPGTAVLYAPYGDSVFVVEEKDGRTVARQQFVRLGQRKGDLVAVESGLDPDETIVTTGAFKLRNGAAITVNNTLAPAASADPKPSDT